MTAFISPFYLNSLAASPKTPSNKKQPFKWASHERISFFIISSHPFFQLNESSMNCEKIQNHLERLYPKRTFSQKILSSQKKTLLQTLKNKEIRTSVPNLTPYKEFMEKNFPTTPLFNQSFELGLQKVLLIFLKHQSRKHSHLPFPIYFSRLLRIDGSSYESLYYYLENLQNRKKKRKELFPKGIPSLSNTQLFSLAHFVRSLLAKKVGLQEESEREKSWVIEPIDPDIEKSLKKELKIVDTESIPSSDTQKSLLSEEELSRLDALKDLSEENFHHLITTYCLENGLQNPFEAMKIKQTVQKALLGRNPAQ